MASNFPKLPGYVPTHDPTLVSHKKISHVKLEKNRNGMNIEVPLYAVPRPATATHFRADKTEASKSLSQTQYVQHLGGNVSEQFEPTFVKLDKQVRRQPNPYLSPSRYFASLATLKSLWLRADLRTSGLRRSCCTTISKTNRL